jgi:hypothetical protein
MEYQAVEELEQEQGFSRLEQGAAFPAGRAHLRAVAAVLSHVTSREHHCKIKPRGKE